MGSNENTMHVDDVHRKPQKAWEQFVVLWRVGRISQKLHKDVVNVFDQFQLKIASFIRSKLNKGYRVIKSLPVPSNSDYLFRCKRFLEAFDVTARASYEPAI